MKLRNGWKSHGTQWNYKENSFGVSVESVVQFIQRGQKKYEAHFHSEGCCGSVNSISDLWDSKRFDNREDAFVFCEQMYERRMARKKQISI